MSTTTTMPRPCSECGQPLPVGSRRDRVTCSGLCREHRRLRRQVESRLTALLDLTAGA